MEQGVGDYEGYTIDYLEGLKKSANFTLEYHFVSNAARSKHSSSYTACVQVRSCTGEA